MALNLATRYPGRANPASIDYPQGSFKNKTAPAATDGTLLEKDWANDTQGFLQSILSYFGVTASGNVDKVGASQYFDALTSSPTELKKGMPLVATTSEAVGLTTQGKMIDPKNLGDVIKTLFGGSTQARQDVTASRSVNTIYTNTTGRPITVSVTAAASATGADVFIAIKINNIDSSVSRTSFGGGIAVNAVIPTGSTYSVIALSISSITNWIEYR